MGTIVNLILEILVYLLFSYILFNLLLKITDGSNKVIDFFIINFKECYGYFRERFCKKSNKVNGNTRTIFYDAELYDSSSEWED